MIETVYTGMNTCWLNNNSCLLLKIISQRETVSPAWFCLIK